MDPRYEVILRYIPSHMKKMMEKVFEDTGDIICEIRVRNGMPLIIGTSSGSLAVSPEGGLSPAVGGAYTVLESDLKQIFQAVCENSVYAFMDDIKQGFITIKGGHRVGFSGRAVIENGQVENFREISSLNIRIAREVIGAANNIIDQIVKPDRIINTLIVSPPMGGKTTVLRDIARQVSNKGIKTAILDDRGEIAALFRGVPQCDVGIQTDVFENAPKEKAISMMLRAMSPQLIITDELATKADVEGILQGLGTGVSVVASVHGSSTEEVMEREYLKPLFGGIGFEQIIVLCKEGQGINTKIFGEVTRVK